MRLMLNKQAKQEGGQLTLRALLIGALGSMVLTASSMYVALRMGALPWPTVFAAIASMSVLKLMGGTNQNEINVAQTAMTAGAMISGGLAFTLPGLWAMGVGPDIQSLALKIALVSLAGLILGLILTWYWRPMLLDQQNLPFPIGIATAETIQAGDAGGAKGRLLGLSLAAAAVYTMIRDWFGKLPQMLTFDALGAFNIQAGLMLWPMAPAIGYMIGILYTSVLMIGALLAYFLIIPFGIVFEAFGDFAQAEAFKNTLGLGLMVGSGMGVLLEYLWNGRKIRRAPVSMVELARKKYTGVQYQQRLVFFLLLVALASTMGAGMDALTGLLVMGGTVLMTLMASLMTGQTGIDPMEIFGIIVMMGVRFLVSPSLETSLLIAAVVAVASGFAGDTMFDYKAGKIIGTDPKAQLLSQAVGGLIGVAVATLTLFAVIGQFGPVFGEALPAPQGAMVFAMVNHAFNPWVFWSGAALGALLVLLKVPSITLGIGMYLPFSFSLAIFLGGLVQWVIRRFRSHWSDHAMVVASGLFGGESLTGVAIAFMSFFKSLS